MRVLGLLCSCLLLTACPKGGKGDESTPPEETPAGEGEQEELRETLGERSQCRTGRIAIPDTEGFLRAVVDEAHGFVVMLPDLPDWAMACSDDPYFIGDAMQGAVSATVYLVEPNDRLETEPYLELLAGQLQSDIQSAGMKMSERQIRETKLGTLVLTFRITAIVDGIEKWQFNYIAARQRPDGAFVNLHLTVTAAPETSSEENPTDVASSLLPYLDMFRLKE